MPRGAFLWNGCVGSSSPCMVETNAAHHTTEAPMAIGFVLTIVAFALLVGFIAILSVAVYRDQKTLKRRMANRAALNIQSDREFDRLMASKLSW